MMNIGFIGVGKMGVHMAGNVLEAGYTLYVNDLKKEAAEPLLEKGAKWEHTPKRIAELCPVVLSCLPAPPDVEKVVYGANGLMEGWKEGDIYVEMSTNSPSLIRRVAADAKAKGVDVIDAPVSGGTKGAEEATLAIMVGGEASILEKVHKVLESIGKNIFHLGDIGCGNIAKLVNNMISSTCNAITAECFVLGAKAGIDPQKLYDVVNVSSGRSYHLERSYPKILRGDFEPGFRVNLMLKDIRLALDLGREFSVPMAVGAAVEQRFVETNAAGYGEKSTGSVIQPLEKLTGVKVRAKMV
jgi:3-hydroxyisobutyrate dehydrogenase-like beta-hydroxyacid dehydrogenase